MADAKQRPPVAGAMLRSAGSRNFARAVAAVMVTNSSRGLQASASSGALAAAAAAAAANPAAAQQAGAAVMANGAPAPRPQLPAPAAPSPFDAPAAAAGAAGAAAGQQLVDSAFASPAQPPGSEAATTDGPMSTYTSGSVLPPTASGSVALGGAASGASVLSGTPPPPSPF